MVKLANADPADHEVRKQLQHILKSQRFYDAFNQSAILKFVVENRLARREIDEDTIGYEVFPNYVADSSTDVRATASNLRKRLANYYAEEGAHDPVIIELLRGKNYKAEFAYNPLSKAATVYAVALRYIENVTSFPFDDSQIRLHFNLIFKSDPDFAIAHATLAELRCLMAACLPFKDPSANLREAEEHAQKAIEINDRLWRPYIVRGIFGILHSDWQLAASEFERAAALAPEEAVRDPFFLAYQAATGQMDEALITLRKCADTASISSFWPTLYGLFLYVARKFREADLVLFSVISANPAAILPRLLLGCCQLGYTGSMKGGAISIQEFDDIRRDYHEEPFGLLGLRAMFMIGAAIETQPGNKLERLTDEDLETWKLYSAWDRALIYVGLQMPDAAIVELENARTEGNPLMIWLHLWPFLDELRDNADFKRLVKRMRFPGPTLLS